MKKPFILLPWDTYPIEGFTDVFCHHIATEDFERTAVIFPHDRIQKHWEGALTRRYADTGALFLPHSYTLFSYVDSLYIRHIQRVHGVRKPIRLYEEVILLHEIIDIYRDSLHVVHTFFSTLAPNVQYAWLHSLIRLIHTCFMEYKEPHELTVDIAMPYAEELCNAFPLLYSLYIDYLDQQRYITPQYKLYLTTQYILQNKDVIQYEDRYKEIFVFGFANMEGAESRLMRSLWEQTSCWICLYTAPSLMQAQSELGCELHRQWITSWGADIQYYPDTTSQEHSRNLILNSNIHIIQYPNIHAQLQHVEEICKEYPDKSIAILPLDSSLLEPLLYYTTAYDVNISIGYPFIHSSIAMLLQYIITLQEMRYDGLYHKATLIRLLEHPYIMQRCIDDTSFACYIESFIAYITSLLQSYVDVQSLHAEFCALHAHDVNNNAHLETILNVCITSWEKMLSYDNLIDTLQRLIEYVQERPNNVLSSIEQAAIACLSTRGLQYFRSHIPTNGFTQYTFALVIREYIYMERIAFRGKKEGTYHVDIIGLSEIQMLSFDIVCFLESIEGNIPHIEQEYGSVTTYIEERVLGLSSATQRIEKEEYHFFSTLYACDTIYIMYASVESQNIGGKAQRSRFIEKLLWREEKAQGRILEDALVKYRSLPQQFEPIVYRDIVTVDGIEEYIIARLQEGISYTMISTYIQCPFKFIQRYIINLMDMTSNVNHGTIGSIIHMQLERFFSPYTHHYIQRGTLLEHKESIIHAIIEDIDNAHNISMEERMIARHTIPQQITLFFEAHPEDFYIEGCEKMLDVDVNGYRFYGRIDRIDIYDGIYYVIDYKTGSKTFSRPALTRLITALEEGQSYSEYIPYLSKAPLQLFLYLYLLHTHYPHIESNAIYYLLAQREVGHIRNAIAHTPYTEEQICHVANVLIGDIIHSMSTLRTIECRRGHHCTYCPYQSLCL